MDYLDKKTPLFLTPTADTVKAFHTGFNHFNVFLLDDLNDNGFVNGMSHKGNEVLSPYESKTCVGS